MTLNQLQTDFHIFQIGELNQIKGFGQLFYLGRFALFQILAKRIIVDIEDDLTGLLHSFGSRAKFIFLGSGNGSSEHVRSGVPHHKSNLPLLAPSFHQRSKQRGRRPVYTFVTRSGPLG